MRTHFLLDVHVIHLPGLRVRWDARWRMIARCASCDLRAPLGIDVHPAQQVISLISSNPEVRGVVRVPWLRSRIVCNFSTHMRTLTGAPWRQLARAARPRPRACIHAQLHIYSHARDAPLPSAWLCTYSHMCICQQRASGSTLQLAMAGDDARRLKDLKAALGRARKPGALVDGCVVESCVDASRARARTGQLPSAFAGNRSVSVRKSTADFLLWSR
jgi:hypothetical protein